jgi:hypothetical protein
LSVGERAEFSVVTSRLGLLLLCLGIFLGEHREDLGRLSAKRKCPHVCTLYDSRRVVIESLTG